MSLRDKIKVVAKSLNPHDGSLDTLNSWEDLIRDEEQMGTLLQNKAFAKLIEVMSIEFRAQLEEVIKKDPELSAQKRMFERTLGLTGAKKQINKIVDELIQNQED